MSRVASARSRPRRRPAAFAATIILAGATASSALASAGAVYTETNAAAGNAAQKFDRSADGRLTPAGSFPTGGSGLDSPGGRQGAVTLSGNTVYAVNSGSDSVSAFHVTRSGLRRLGSVASRGVAPVSVAARGGRVYVLNSGDTPRVGRRASRRSRPGSAAGCTRSRAECARSPRARAGPLRSPSRPTGAGWS